MVNILFMLKKMVQTIFWNLSKFHYKIDHRSFIILYVKTCFYFVVVPWDNCEATFGHKAHF